MAEKAGGKQMLVSTIAGAAGGVTEVKTRFQINERQNTSVLKALRSVMREGGFLRFYRGMLPEAISRVPASAAMYNAFDTSRKFLAHQRADYLTRKTGTHVEAEVTVPIAFVAGACAGIPEAMAVQPFQVIKVRLQAVEHLGRYRNSFDCVAKILKVEGIRGMLTGFGPTCWRNVVWDCIYFGLMHTIKDALPKPTTQSREVLQTFAVGSLCGMIATCANVPFDVVKSRWQAQLPEVYGGPPRRIRWTLQAIKAIYQTEGALALYKGWAPKMWRMGVGGGVSIATIETVVLLSKNAAY